MAQPPTLEEVVQEAVARGYLGSAAVAYVQARLPDAPAAMVWDMAASFATGESDEGIPIDQLDVAD